MAIDELIAAVSKLTPEEGFGIDVALLSLIPTQGHVLQSLVNELNKRHPDIEELSSQMGEFAQALEMIDEFSEEATAYVAAEVEQVLEDIVPSGFAEAFQLLNDCLENVESLIDDGAIEEVISAIETVTAPLEDVVQIFEMGKPFFDLLEAYP